MLREYSLMKEDIENPRSAVEYTIYMTMEFCCVSCKKSTSNENSSVRKTKQYRLMLVSNCTVCGKKKMRVIMNQEASRLKIH